MHDYDSGHYGDQRTGAQESGKESVVKEGGLKADSMSGQSRGWAGGTPGKGPTQVMTGRQRQARQAGGTLGPAGVMLGSPLTWMSWEENGTFRAKTASITQGLRTPRVSTHGHKLDRGFPEQEGGEEALSVISTFVTLASSHSSPHSGQTICFFVKLLFYFNAKAREIESGPKGGLPRETPALGPGSRRRPSAGRRLRCSAAARAQGIADSGRAED